VAEPVAANLPQLMQISNLNFFISKNLDSRLHKIAACGTSAYQKSEPAQ
jgi:hypothetical protein